MALFRLFLCLFIVYATSLAAQDGVIPATDMRSRALGGTGLAAGGLNALWTNPAGLATLGAGEFGAAAGAEQRWGLSQLRLLNVGGVYGTGLGGFGGRLATFGFEAYRETRFGLSYGRSITDRFHVGAGFHGFASSTAGYAGTFDVTISLGGQLVIVDELSVGAYLFSPVRRERIEEEYLPQLLALGFAYTPTDQLRVNVEAHQGTEYPARFRLGLEYIPVAVVSIRLGVVTRESELTFGLGYTVLPGLEVSGGAGWHEVLGLSPGFGLRWWPVGE